MVPIAPSSTCTLESSISSRRVAMSALVGQVGGEPALHRPHVHALTPGIVHHLIPLNLAHAEVLGLGPPEVVAADRGRGEHGEAFGESHSGLPLGAEYIEER